MDVEKPASKGHSFFALFDWGKKSKKRLFSGSGSSSPAQRNSGDGKEADDDAPSTQSNSILEDVPSLKESSEHSCSSSVIDDESHARRSPTVVARLMGLDSMPVASSSDSYSTPLPVQQPLQNNVLDELIGRSYVGSPHKTPGSPIDRFKIEALPPRFAKRTLSVAQYKLLSPIKNPNHISSRNAADIMEAASKIIGPGVDNTSSHRVCDFGYTNAVRAYNPREIVRVQQRGSPRPNEALKKLDGSASARPPKGKSLDGSLRTSESTASRISQSNGGAPVGPKVKVSCKSSPDYGATNNQRREFISKSSRKLASPRDPECNMVDKNDFSQEKGNNQMGTASSSNQLLRNNRKQNATGVKHKVNSKSATLSQQRSDNHSINASPSKVGVASTIAEKSTQGNRRMELPPTNHANRRLNSTAKTIPKPRRLPTGRMYSEKSQSSDKAVADRSHTRIRHNIVMDEQSSFSTNKKKVSTEIVSFTFTSPVDKSLPGSHLPNRLVGKRLMENTSSVPTSSSTTNNKLDSIDGDYLGLLLEQKLRELTSGVRSPYSKPAKGARIYAPLPVLEDTGSTCETSSIASTDYDGESIQSHNDGKVIFQRPDHASKSDQPSQSVKYDNGVMDQAELEHLQLSPHSAWEASLSTETCSSSESWRSGTKLFSSAEGMAASDSVHYGKFLEVDAMSEYSDTASSITVTTAEIPPSESSSSHRMDCKQEIYFIREILIAGSLSSHICAYLERFDSSDILDPHLLEELNNSFRLAAGEEEGKTFRMTQRLLFDCVNEILSVKCAYYFNAGYGSWFMGMAVLHKLSAEEIYREMTSLKVDEEWMVDELVYREMSSPLGSWVDFKMESYEAGSDITADLVGFLIDEMVDDLITDALL